MSDSDKESEDPSSVASLPALLADDAENGDTVYRYRDFSHVSKDDEAELATETPPPTPSSRGNSESSIRVQKFPVKLYVILAQKEFHDIISWMPHGRSWKVLKPSLFESMVMPLFFEYSNYHSFNRLVNAWSFRRISSGPDRGSYYHELFLRGMPHLHKYMRRLPKTHKKLPMSKKDEPDFYALDKANPLPSLEDAPIPCVTPNPQGNGGSAPPQQPQPQYQRESPAAVNYPVQQTPLVSTGGPSPSPMRHPGAPAIMTTPGSLSAASPMPTPMVTRYLRYAQDNLGPAGDEYYDAPPAPTHLMQSHPHMGMGMAHSVMNTSAMGAMGAMGHSANYPNAPMTPTIMHAPGMGASSLAQSAGIMQPSAAVMQAGSYGGYGVMNRPQLRPTMQFRPTQGPQLSIDPSSMMMQPPQQQTTMDQLHASFGNPFDGGFVPTTANAGGFYQNYPTGPAMNPAMSHGYADACIGGNPRGMMHQHLVMDDQMMMRHPMSRRTYIGVE